MIHLVLGFRPGLGRARAAAAGALLAVLAAGAVVGADDHPMSAPATAPAGPVLPKIVLDMKTDEATLALIRGDYQTALRIIDPTLEQSQKLDVRLFQHGVAHYQAAMAATPPDVKSLADAGLSFMRVIVHFDRAGSPYVGPSLVWAGLVQQKLGHNDAALDLYKRSRDYLDKNSDKDLVVWRDQLLNDLEPAKKTTPTPSK